jgi:hypothetical protein
MFEIPLDFRNKKLARFGSSHENKASLGDAKSAPLARVADGVVTIDRKLTVHFEVELNKGPVPNATSEIMVWLEIGVRYAPNKIFGNDRNNCTKIDFPQSPEMEVGHLIALGFDRARKKRRVLAAQAGPSRANQKPETATSAMTWVLACGSANPEYRQ